MSLSQGFVDNSLPLFLSNASPPYPPVRQATINKLQLVTISAYQIFYESFQEASLSWTNGLPMFAVEVKFC
jgi:hypothetical protein